MPLILGANTLTAGGYEVDNSLRFEPSSSDYLNRTSGTSTDNKKLTFSFWVKRGDSGREQHYVNSSGTACQTYFASDDKIYFTDGTASGQYKTTQVFRDFSAWYHFVFAEDTTQATASDRIKIYVNGTQITAFDIATTPTLNANSGWNANSTATFIGRYNPSPTGYYYSGYMSEFNFIDGQQLTPSDFGEFDADTGIWKPIAYEGTYGNNGFYLEFKDSSALGDDTSGEGNNFTVNNLTSIDQTTDTPTNNFATLNPLSTVFTENISSMLSNGNVDYTPSGDYSIVKSTIPFGTTGKWYVEVKDNTSQGGGNGLGIQRLPATSYATNSFLSYQCNDYCYSYQGDGIIKKGSTSNTTVASGLTVITAGDIIAMLFDADNNEIKWYNNDTLVYTLDLSTAPDGYYINDGEWVCAYMGYGGYGTRNMNFGNPAITISSGNSDANGYGNFEYDTKSGYALCTKNLAEYG